MPTRIDEKQDKKFMNQEIQGDEEQNSSSESSRLRAGETPDPPTGLEAKQKAFKDFVLEESRKGNVVCMDFEGPMVAPLDEFIKQTADGILYDLNRLPEVVLTFINDPKWVNDFAVSMVIRRLKEKLDEANQNTIA